MLRKISITGAFSLVLAACQSTGGGCPPLVAYSLEEQKIAAKQLRALPKNAGAGEPQFVTIHCAFMAFGRVCAGERRMRAARGSWRRALTVAALAATAAFARPSGARAEEAQPRLQCFTMAQARVKMEANKLADPFQCMRETAHRLQGEPLGARLCQLGEGLIYEISLLRRDGHIVKILVDAFSGRPQSGSIDAAPIAK